jgi:AcrR family transcriptional regulator
MRLRDENKRKLIVQTAVKLFSEQPFDKVRLDDVAAAAGVGKGTVYIYFKNKEELYYSLITEGFTELLTQVKEKLATQGGTATEKLRTITAALTDHVLTHPRFIEVLRTVGVPDATSPWDAKRKEFTEITEEVIHQGIAAGEFTDAHPDRTAKYLMAMVRAVLLYDTTHENIEGIVNHVWSSLVNGIGKKTS